MNALFLRLHIFSLATPWRVTYSLLFNAMSALIVRQLVGLWNTNRWPFSLFIPLMQHITILTITMPINSCPCIYTCAQSFLQQQSNRKVRARTVSLLTAGPRMCYCTRGQSALQIVEGVSTIDKGQSAGRASRSISLLIHVSENAKQVAIMSVIYKAR